MLSRQCQQLNWHTEHVPTVLMPKLLLVLDPALLIFAVHVLFPPWCNLQVSV